MSRHYVLDFDGTLYDTEVLWRRWAEVLVALGVDYGRADETAIELFHRGFTLSDHASLLGIEGEKQERLVKAFEDWVQEVGAGIVYQDVSTFLQGKHSTILTHGEEAFQRLKIFASGLGQHVKDIRIAGPDYRKAKHLAQMLESTDTPLLFVDDNPSELAAVHEAGLPVELVRMRREGARHSILDHELDDQAWRVIRSLDELE